MTPDTANQKPQATSRQPQATSHKQRATSHEPRATSHEPRATSHEPRIPCDILIVGGSAGGVAAALAAAELALRSACWKRRTGSAASSRYRESARLTRTGMSRPSAALSATPRSEKPCATITAPPTTCRSRAARSSGSIREAPGSAASPSSRRWAPRSSPRWSVLSWNRAGSKSTTQRGPSSAPSTPNGRIVSPPSSRICRTGRFTFAPQFVLDATDTGDLLPLCGEEDVDWTVGAESQAETGEPDAPESPARLGAALHLSVRARLVAGDRRHQRHRAARRLPRASRASEVPHQARRDHRSSSLDARPGGPIGACWPQENFDDPRVPADLAMINTAGNDYYGGNVIGTAWPGDATRPGGRDVGPRPPGLARLPLLAPDGMPARRRTGDPAPATPNSACGATSSTPRTAARSAPTFASRVASAHCVAILEQEIVVRDFRGNVCRGEQGASGLYAGLASASALRAGHPSQRPRRTQRTMSRPGPSRFRWVRSSPPPGEPVPACQELGTTHLTNGAYRLHPIEWNIGKSAGLLAAFCLRANCLPANVAARQNRLRALQADLLAQEHPAAFVRRRPRRPPRLRGRPDTRQPVRRPTRRRTAPACGCRAYCRPRPALRSTPPWPRKASILTSTG